MGKIGKNAFATIWSVYDELEEAIKIMSDEYAKAQQMFSAFGCKTLFDYQVRYLELDCRLLADVFEEFRRLTRK